MLYVDSQLLSEIKEVRRTRALQRASRKRHGGSHSIPTIAVVGYTNAGKSTLVSALTDTYLYSDDRLFATVDPKLSSVLLPSGRKVLLSDTVGFISDLPVQLVEAFHATLEEVVEADILLHVLDSSAPNLDEQRKTVFQVLEQIGVSEEKLESMIEAWNKIDLEEEEFHFDEESAGEMNAEMGDWLASEGEEEEEEEEDSWVDYDESTIGCGDSDGTWVAPGKGWWWTRKSRDLAAKSSHGPHVKTSALTGVGLQELLELIDERVNQVPLAAPEATIFGRKWRPPPPQMEDATGVPVGG